MRFMMLMIPKGYEDAAPGTMPDPDAVAAMMKYNDELQKAGVLLALDGLHPPSMGARVSFEGGRPTVTDGPFPEAKEVVGGYWIIQVRSREEAIEWARRCPVSENEVIEVRQIQDAGDFPPEVRQVVEAYPDVGVGAGQPGAESSAAQSTIEKSGDLDIVITALVHAPRERVYAAWTDPAAVPHWWGPRRFTTTVERMDVRPGGGWRYVSRNDQGEAYAFHGEYREVAPPERVVATFAFEGRPGDPAFETVNTATFEERDGGTLVTETSTYPSREVRDRDFEHMSGPDGNEMWERFDEYLRATG